MIILTAKEYEERKFNFLHNHCDWEVHTSPMDSDGTYRKDYVCVDGAHLYEVMRPVYKKVEIEVCKIRTEVEIKLLETESWNTEYGDSVFYYEKF